AARVLRPVRDELGRHVDLAHVELATIARFVGTEAPRGNAGKKPIDDVRLACAPASRTPGLRGIELALAAAAPGAHAALPEVLVRVEDGSEAAARLFAFARGATVVPGRCPEEKVARIVPSEATPRGTARALADVIRALEGRRATDREAEPA